MRRVWVVIEKSKNEGELGKVVGIYEKPNNIPENIEREVFEWFKSGTETKHKVICVTLAEVNMLLNKMAYWYKKEYSTLTPEEIFGEVLEKEWIK